MDLQLTYDSTALASLYVTTVLAGDGILDTIGEKAAELQALLRVIGTVCGVGFVIYQAITSKGALSRVVVSGLAAGVFIWIVFNVTELRDRVDNEVTASGTARATSPAVSEVTALTAAAAPGPVLAPAAPAAAALRLQPVVFPPPATAAV